MKQPTSPRVPAPNSRLVASVDQSSREQHLDVFLPDADMCLGRICEDRFPSNAPARRGAGLGCRKRSVAGPTSESRPSGHRWLRDNPLAPGPPVRRGDGLGKVLHPGPTYEHSSAKIETKAECIAHATKPSSLLKAIEFSRWDHADLREYGHLQGGRVISRLQPTS
jgi:hypothetical protein